MNFKDNLKKIRKENNLSQEELADKLNVSRQSVSKWESGLAYPEMDKVLQICKIFNLNMDDLLNKNISEIKTKEKEVNKSNKQIDFILNYINKTIRLFSTMKFKGIIKCLFEQAFLCFIFFIIYLVLSSLNHNIIGSLLIGKISNMIYQYINSLFSILYLILVIFLLLYIFKIRYLDYYKVIDKEDSLNNEELNNEKVIIRDPKSSSHVFFKTICKLFIISFKVLFGMFSIGFVFSLIFFVILLVLSFLFVKTGIMFIGTLIMLIGLITINILIIIVIYNFIFNQKSKWSRYLIIFIISFILFGIGFGLIAIGIKDFDVIDINDNKYYVTETKEFDMADNMIIHDYSYKTNYIIEDIDNIKIEIIKPKTSLVYANNMDNNIYFTYYDNYNFMKNVRYQIKLLSNKKVVFDSNLVINIYLSKENYDKIINNKNMN